MDEAWFYRTVSGYSVVRMTVDPVNKQSCALFQIRRFITMRRSALSFIVTAMAATAVIGMLSPSAAAQARPDLSGLFDGAGGSSDIVPLMERQGTPVPFTPAAAERYKKVDFAKNPNGFCLPPGPSRAITGPSPFLIVQSADVISINFENHGVYRIIYLDGRPHPPEIMEYPQFMGHSIGRWEGDTLVVDTIGINDRTWLDSNGLEHSDKLHLVERFRKTGPDVIEYAVTYEDPEFFTKPWTLKINLNRQKDTRLMEYVCNDNEKDRIMLQPTFRDQE